MTPIEFADLYRQMDVYMIPLDESNKHAGTVMPAGTWRRLKVASYRLGDSAYRDTFFGNVKKHIGKDGVSVLVKCPSGGQETVVFLNHNKVWQHFRHPFAGKGTPEQCQLTIQLTYRFHKTSATFRDVEKFTAASFIGLDCNGFVGNYIQRRRAGDATWTTPANLDDPGPNSSIATLVRLPGNTVLKSRDEIAAGTRDIYILGMCTANGFVYDRIPADNDRGFDYGHIMITEPGTARWSGKQLTIRVVESSPSMQGGLQDNDYEILEPAPLKKGEKEAVFTVLRGNSGGRMLVKIARLGG